MYQLLHRGLFSCCAYSKAFFELPHAEEHAEYAEQHHTREYDGACPEGPPVVLVYHLISPQGVGLAGGELIIFPGHVRLLSFCFLWS